MSGMSEPRTVSLLETTELSEKKMLSVPSVTMNGGSLSRVTSKPLRAPIAVPQTQPDQQRQHAGHAQLGREVGHQDRGEHRDRAGGQVDAGGQDDQGLAQRQGGDHGDLGDHQAEVRGRQEPAGDDREGDDRDEQDRERAQDRVGVQDVLDALQRRRACAGRSRRLGVARWPLP